MERNSVSQIATLLDNVLIAVGKGSALQVAIEPANGLVALLNNKAAAKRSSTTDTSNCLASIGGNGGGERGHDKTSKGALDCNHFDGRMGLEIDWKIGKMLEVLILG